MDNASKSPTNSYARDVVANYERHPYKIIKRQMNYKLRTLLIATLISNYCFAQDLILKCDNSQPRKGQPITISLQVDFIDDIILGSIPFDYKSSNFMSVFDNRTFSKQIIVNDTGEFKIGPIELTYNNKIIKSNEITLKVLPPLPQLDGIWIRQIDNGDKKYIILEQNIIVKIDRKLKNDEIVFQMDKLNNTPIAEIDIPSIKTAALKQLTSNSSSKMDKNSQPFTRMIKTSIIIYEIEEIKGNILTISDSNMKNLVDKRGFKEVSFDIQ